MGRSGEAGAPARHRAVSRRADRNAGRRTVYPQHQPPLQRILRRELDGATAGGDRDHRTHAAIPSIDPANRCIQEGHCCMTLFRSDTAPPAWCELEHFEVITLQRGEAITRSRFTRTERLIGTGGTCQLRRGNTSLLLKEAQFIDLDPDDGAWTVLGA